MSGVLLLFDIDGTLLLRASAEHAAALRDALTSVYGVTTRSSASSRPGAPTRRSHAISPRSPGVERERFDAGLEGFRRRAPRLRRRAARRASTDHVAPGMPELLDGARGARRTCAARW